MPKYRKARNLQMTEEYLNGRQNALKGRPSMWLAFCRIMLRRGFTVHLYEAQFTASKYVTLAKGDKRFKVRFSNHEPLLHREANGDCDFFVGHTNFGVTNTNGAVQASLSHFGEWNAEDPAMWDDLFELHTLRKRVKARTKEQPQDYAMQFEDLEAIQEGA